MKKYLPVLVASGVLLFSFQNCSQQKAMSSSNSTEAPQSKIEDPILAQAQSLDILTQNQDDTINVNLSTGQMTQNVQGTIITKCLSDSVRGQINDLLVNSALCDFPEPGPDVACAQVYSAPYSDIHWADKDVKVGEAFSSCQKNVDLCGNDGVLLRGILKTIVSNWNSYSCDFQVVSN
jgi:hypothetical protein